MLLPEHERNGKPQCAKSSEDRKFDPECGARIAHQSRQGYPHIARNRAGLSDPRRFDCALRRFGSFESEHAELLAAQFVIVHKKLFELFDKKERPDCRFV